MSLVQLLKLGFLKKWGFQKVQYEKVFFEKAVKKCFFEKAECLANTYKSGNLSGKLPKRTMYI